jgi:hypothetical protein
MMHNCHGKNDELYHAYDYLLGTAAVKMFSWGGGGIRAIDGDSFYRVGSTII